MFYCFSAILVTYVLLLFSNLSTLCFTMFYNVNCFSAILVTYVLLLFSNLSNLCFTMFYNVNCFSAILVTTNVLQCSTMLTAFQQYYRLVFIIGVCKNRPVKSDLNQISNYISTYGRSCIKLYLSQNNKRSVYLKVS